MPPLSNAVLRELCSTPLETLRPRPAFEKCRRLGPLARWWFRPEVLELAHEYDDSYPALTSSVRPELPRSPGTCVVLFRSKTDLPLLRRAFLLPLCWRQQAAHSPLLPGELIRLADRIVGQAQPKDDKRPWSLVPADGLDLSQHPLGPELHLEYESGWAALAAGLMAASGGLLPCNRVLASAAWGPNGLVSVSGLVDKLALAAEWEATDFFVPVWQVEEAAKEANQSVPGLRIGGLVLPLTPNQPGAAQIALRPYLARLTVRPEPPPPEQPDEPIAFQACRNYFLYQEAFSESERGFYRSHLFEGIVHRLRGRITREWPHANITHLATVVSPSHELAILAARALGAKHVLLLYQEDHSPPKHGKPTCELAAECVQHLNEKVPGVVCTRTPFKPGPEMWADIDRAVRAFGQQVPAEHLALDLKPGTKRMTYTISRAARPGNWVFNLEAHFLNDRRTDPGTEIPDLWQVSGTA